MGLLFLPPTFTQVIEKKPPVDDEKEYFVLVFEKWTSEYPGAYWDFYFIDDWSEFTDWSIKDNYYISPPTSIFFGHRDEAVYLLSKHPGAQNLKAGRLTCWNRSQIFGVGYPTYYIGVTGVGSEGIEFRPFREDGVWRRARYAWWQGKDGEGNDKTVVYRETWEDDAWVDPETFYYDPMTGAVNRVGIGSQPQSVGYKRWYDDTIIERRVE